jgi:hypothetical protein
MVRGPMPAFDYRYEIRRGDEIVATGHLTREQPLEAGDRIVIGTSAGTVRSVEPVLGEREVRLVVQVRAGTGDCRRDHGRGLAVTAYVYAADVSRLWLFIGSIGGGAVTLAIFALADALLGRAAPKSSEESGRATAS